MRSPFCIARHVLVLLCCLLVIDAVRAEAKAPPEAVAAYGEGLDALRDGRFADATAAFGRAMARSDDAEFVLARGVSLVHWNMPRSPRHGSITYATSSGLLKKWSQMNRSIPDKNTPQSGCV